MRPSLSFQQPFIFAILFTVFTIAYILTPYWIIAPSVWEQYFFLVTSTGLGLIWAYLSSSGLELQFQKRDWLPFIILFMLLGLLNYRTLFAAIPWKGDEDYHITVTLGLWSLMKLRGLLLAPLFTLFLFEGWRKSRQILFSALVLVLFVALMVSRDEVDYEWILRYPAIIKWFSLVPLYLTVPIMGLVNEASFRIIPFTSVVMLVWFCQHQLSHYNKGLGFIAAFAIGTIPLILYYTSIVYLELPAVVLMTIVCFDIKNLLKGSMADITKRPAWYALILIGFIKETTLPFLISFALCRFIIRFWPLSKIKIRLADIIDEAKIIFCTFFPLLLYVFYRILFGVRREFSPNLLNLFNSEVYVILLRAFWEQFGPFIFLFIAGCVVLGLKKQYRILLFLIFSFLADVVFHLIDEIDYVGYSRFNLFLVPTIMAGAYSFLGFLSQKNTKLTGLVLSGVIAANFLLSPINVDGTKKPLWGNYVADTSEHYYPYREAILWLKENHHAHNIRFTGMYYPYFFEFYFAKFNWFPVHDIKVIDQGVDEVAALEQSLFEAKKDGVQVVLYQVLGADIPEARDTQGFVQEKIFRNQAHMLVLYAAATR